LNVAAVRSEFGRWAKRTGISNVYRPFSDFGNWITFGPLRRRCLFYIELHCSLPSTPSRCCYYFTSHKKIRNFVSPGL